MSGYLQGTPDLADFVQALSRHRVAYMVVGGHAVGFHSRPRATKDLDVWIDPSEDNLSRLLRALEEYGAPAQVRENVRRANVNEIVWFGRPPNRIDLLKRLPAVQFEEAYRRAAFVQSGEQRIPILAAEDLIKNKAYVGRAQDLADVEVLRRYESHNS